MNNKKDGETLISRLRIVVIRKCDYLLSKNIILEEEILSLIKLFFKGYLELDYELSFVELVDKVKECEVDPETKKETIIFLEEISKTIYSGGKFTTESLQVILNQFKDIVNFLLEEKRKQRLIEKGVQKALHLHFIKMLFIRKKNVNSKEIKLDGEDKTKIFSSVRAKLINDIEEKIGKQNNIKKTTTINNLNKQTLNTNRNINNIKEKNVLKQSSKQEINDDKSKSKTQNYTKDASIVPKSIKKEMIKSNLDNEKNKEVNNKKNYETKIEKKESTDSLTQTAFPTDVSKIKNTNNIHADFKSDNEKIMKKELIQKETNFAESFTSSKYDLSSDRTNNFDWGADIKKKSSDNTMNSKNMNFVNDVRITTTDSKADINNKNKIYDKDVGEFKINKSIKVEENKISIKLKQKFNLINSQEDNLSDLLDKNYLREIKEITNDIEVLETNICSLKTQLKEHQKKEKQIQKENEAQKQKEKLKEMQEKENKKFQINKKEPISKNNQIEKIETEVSPVKFVKNLNINTEKIKPVVFSEDFDNLMKESELYLKHTSADSLSQKKSKKSEKNVNSDESLFCLELNDLILKAKEEIDSIKLVNLKKQYKKIMVFYKKLSKDNKKKFYSDIKELYEIILNKK